MKKIFNIGCLLVGIIMISTSTILAQTSGDIQVSGGLAYGSQIEKLGITADGYYTINEQFRAGASLTYFFPYNYPGGSMNWFSIDLNGHYILHNEDGLIAYGLAGINIISAKTEYDAGGFGSGSVSTSETGLNIGGGVEYGLDFGNLFGELKYAGLGGNADQLAVSAGVRFPIQ